ncbi:MAG: hypothetical protein HYR50_08940 [Candidatus Rokubacteria bacterium]|nr:hypothetical protein [Candidatus Rokubacteria bacterium]
MDACIEAVEHAFRLRGEGRADPPGILGVHARDGGFHIKAGLLDLGRHYFAAKTNAGRLTDDEIVIFDSTGMALQDVAAAAAVDEHAVEAGRGLEVNLAA